jgi:kinesin family protein 11
LDEQQSEAERLRDQMVKANEELAQRNSASNARLAALMEEERKQQATEHEALMSQMSALINSTTKKQQDRIAATLEGVRSEFDEHRDVHNKANKVFITDSQSWSSRAQELVGHVIESRESVKTKIKSDFAVSTISISCFSPVVVLTSAGCKYKHRVFAHCN